MRKLFSIIAMAAVISSCSTTEEDILKKSVVENPNVISDDFELIEARVADGLKGCYSMNVLHRQMQENPGLIAKMQAIENHTQKYINAKKPDNPGGGPPDNGGNGGDPVPFEGTVEIPVVVHVIYSNSAQNISDQQINSQISILNDDFNAGNNDLNQVPSEFASVVGDVEIHFTLDQVKRIPSSTSQWGTNDAMKFSSNGGSDVVDPANKLNIWVCNIGGGILGYAQFPGGNSATDGVVIGPEYFGNTGTATYPFDEGRTATHEIGHWLNLRHIWGDGRCNKDDFVNDTPTSDGPNYGCPAYPTVNCRSNDMTMNYMDYTNDACMYMFSNGQVDRMRALFSTNGVREDIVLP